MGATLAERVVVIVGSSGAGGSGRQTTPSVRPSDFLSAARFDAAHNFVTYLRWR